MSRGFCNRLPLVWHQKLESFIILYYHVSFISSGWISPYSWPEITYTICDFPFFLSKNVKSVKLIVKNIANNNVLDMNSKRLLFCCRNQLNQGF